jgi:hypothetical protein
MLPTDHKARKDFPLLTVLSAYFPDAIEALVELCKAGNVQHNVSADAVNPFQLPEDRITWDRSKSTDQLETLMRHTWDHVRAKRGTGSVVDTDGHLHIIKAFWRAGAEAQQTIEALRKDAAAEEVLIPSDPGPNINGESPTAPIPAMLVDDVTQGWSRGMPVPKGRYVGPDGKLNTPADPLYRDLPAV